MNRLIVCRRLAALGLFLFAACPLFAASTTLVRIASFSFTPALVTITNGDSVTWSNTVALTPHDSTSGQSLWASGLLSPPNTFTFTFNNAGSYPYFCNTHRLTHPEQTGTVSVVIGTPNVLPTVSIITPTNNSVFTAPATVVVEATASDSDGTVSSVNFTRNGTTVRFASSSPYRATNSNLGVGTYTLGAIATDNSGGKATNTISITVLPAPNPVQIVNPRVNGGSFQFSFATEAQRTYSVEAKLQLSPPSWGVLTNLTGNGNSATVTDTIGSQSRFYRVGVQ